MARDDLKINQSKYFFFFLSFNFFFRSQHLAGGETSVFVYKNILLAILHVALSNLPFSVTATSRYNMSATIKPRTDVCVPNWDIVDLLYKAMRGKQNHENIGIIFGLTLDSMQYYMIMHGARSRKKRPFVYLPVAVKVSRITVSVDTLQTMRVKLLPPINS